jgi:transmembrane sensor
MSASFSQDVPHNMPMAGGQPLHPAIADQAADWLTLLMSGEASEAERARWQAWRAEHPDHERAWRHIESIVGRLKVLQPKAAYQSLSPYAGEAPRQPGRRQALQLLLWGGFAGAAATLGSRTQTWQSLSASHRTATGEQRSWTLEDGTQLQLNTASAVSVLFDDTQRRLRLHAGELMIVTGHTRRDGQREQRPFIVETAEGEILALGTRFSVRQHAAHSQVIVFESAVEIRPRGASAGVQRLNAGERLAFSASGFGMSSAIDEQDGAWTRGQIIADNMRLADFVAELARYRPGIVRCTEDVAELRLSGVFPLQDTDRILANLPNVLPLAVQQRSRYWVTVMAAAAR